jgi:uncharacterized protein DUF4349/putative zinc finger protein
MSTTEHPRWEEELMPYVDGQLEGESAARVTAHLAACSECRKAVEDTKKLSAQMSQWKIEPASDRMKDVLLSEFHRKERNAMKWWNRRWAWSIGAGGAVATAAVLLLVFNLQRSRLNSFTLSSDLPSQDATPAESRLDPLALETGRQAQAGQGQPGIAGKFQKDKVVESSGPMIIRSLHISLVAKDLDVARTRIDELVRQAHGYVDQFGLNGEKGSVRTLSATLRLPADQIDAGLVELRKLGQVKAESQNSMDVTSSYVDLVARQNNARNTEQRLLALLRDRTGNLKDVVAVEHELSSTREEIERMEAQRKTLQTQVQYATIQVEMSEEYRAGLEPLHPSTANQLRNAAVDGYQLLSSTALALTMAALTYGPTLLLFAIIVSGTVFLALRLRGHKTV